MTSPEIDPLSVFPSNALGLIALRLPEKLNVGVPEDDYEYVQVQQEPITALNAGAVVAVLPIDWSVAGDAEMGTFPRDPHPIQQYGFIIQCMVTDHDQTRGLARLSLLSRRVRNTLISDRVLHQALQTLRCTEDETLEAFHALRVQRQEFLISREETAGPLYLSTTDATVVTEVVGPI